jgi:hypothetical protein
VTFEGPPAATGAIGSIGTLGTWVRHEVALAALAEVLGVLERARIPVLAVKGIVLAYVLHDDVADRPLSDVDLRVRPRDLFRVVGAMGRSGFAAHWPSLQLGAVSFDVRSTLIEFEVSVGPPGLCSLRVARMLDRSEERVLGGALRVRAPEIHDHAVILLVNAFKDKMVHCPSWSLDDLDAIASRVDPETLLARLREARVRAIAWIAADWMANERQSKSWRQLRDRIGTRPPRRLYTCAMQRWMTSASFMARGLSRIGSDSTPQQVWALTAGGAGTALSWLAQRFPRSG